MIRHLPEAGILFILFTGCSAVLAAGSITGKVSFEDPQQGAVILRAYRLDTFSDGRVKPLSKADIYGAATPAQVLQLPEAGNYAFPGLSPGYYAVVAFCDADNNGNLGFDPPEPFGWYNDLSGSRFSAINLTEGNKTGADILLRTPTPFALQEKHTEHGALKRINGLPVLQLWGTAQERGFAHGYLAGRQIIDFFEFYVLEDSWRSPKRYETVFVPFLENRLAPPHEFLAECDAVMNGMKAAGTNMYVRLLGRDFTRTDLLAVNAYIERRAASPGPAPSSCTQFAFWGERTKGTSVNGGLIAARNMDGECDVRKVTVSHFLLFAVDPAEPGHKRWVSAMWPGFVGTISGVNEEGLYSMENAGGSGPGPVPDRVVPCSWIQRDLLEHAGSDATPGTVLDRMKKYGCSEGGITAAGSIILWAVPYHGQEAPAFVYEGGRSGYAVRKPGDVRPEDPFCIMASNHHKVYGYDPDHPDRSLGVPVSFSSRWRYEAGMQKLEARARQRKPLGTEEAKALLQTVAHGTTEYSVIFLANEKRILVAVDDLKTDLWDAPYQKWVEYGFEELFIR
ncbi:MAG: DUF2141 domain-containing protein [Chlorobi bacterium]|nr:DUF2141 domain-containing protein [Chlorobiota bacterium]